jgi:hypothetical protein
MAEFYTKKRFFVVYGGVFLTRLFPDIFTVFRQSP